MTPAPPLPRALELFAGIGGFAAAAAGQADVVAAIDQHEHAHATYVHNFEHPAHRWNIVGLRAAQLARLDAHLWWMSPPCQPFTVRGTRRDIDDPRCQPLLRVLELIEELTPTAIALENVATFAGSRAHGLVRHTLTELGYHVAERQLCPGQLGVPNKRPRFYLIAARRPLPAWPELPGGRHPLRRYLDPDPDPTLWVEREVATRYRHALAVTDVRHPEPTTYCFTSAYGRSPVHAGSYLRSEGGLRRFSPAEILRLLHFPERFAFPDQLDRARRYALAGNSLSVVAVRHVIAPLLTTLREHARR